MMNLLELLDRLPPLKIRVSPNRALVIGLLTGCIGLPIYFRSQTDFFILILVQILIVALAGTFTLPGAIAICISYQGLYGYLRAVISNRRRELNIIKNYNDTEKPPQ